MMTDFVIWLASGLGDWAGGQVLSGMGINVEEHEKKKAAKEAARAEKAKKTEERRSADKEKESGVEQVPLDDEDAEFMEEMDDLRGQDVAVSGPAPKKPKKPKEPEDPKAAGKRRYERKRRSMGRRRGKLGEQARQIEAAGGTTGVFRRGKLVEVDGKPYTAPEPAPSSDSRAGAAAGIQNAALDKSNRASGGGAVVINNTDNSTAGSKNTLQMPPPSFESDPSLATPIQ
jgi:hypothetical protein